MKRTLTLNEGAAVLEKDRKAKRKAEEAEAEAFDIRQWVPIEKKDKKVRWIVKEEDSSDLGNAGTPDMPRATRTIMDVFLSLFTNTVITSLAQALAVCSNMRVANFSVRNA